MGRLWDKPYEERSDEERILTQWIKMNGLLRRRDWSAAVVRAATAMEMSANLALTHSYASDLQLTEEDLTFALRFPLKRKLKEIKSFLADDQKQRIDEVKVAALKTYEKRNRIVHAGEFCDDEEAIRHATASQTFVMTLVPIYRPQFLLTREAISSEDDPGS